MGLCCLCKHTIRIDREVLIFCLLKLTLTQNCYSCPYLLYFFFEHLLYYMMVFAYLVRQVRLELEVLCMIIKFPRPLLCMLDSDIFIHNFNIAQIFCILMHAVLGSDIFIHNLSIVHFHTKLIKLRNTDRNYEVGLLHW